MRAEMPNHVWVAYSGKPPYLPIAVADTAKELAREVRVSVETVRTGWCKYCRGQRKRTRYHKVNFPTEGEETPK